MPRSAQQATGAPFAKLVRLGDTLVGAWGGSMRRQARDFESGKPAYRRDDPTRAVNEEVDWFVAMPGTTAHTGNIDDPQAIEPGDVVRWVFQGYKWGQAIEARKALPALPAFDIRAGREASSDVYTITLAGWSVQTENPEAARKAGFTVVEKRIVLRSDDERENYVLAQSKRGGNTNVGKDLTVAVRRIELPNEQKWADLADELWDSAPWKITAAAAGDTSHTPAEDMPEEPF